MGRQRRQHRGTNKLQISDPPLKEWEMREFGELGGAGPLDIGADGVGSDGHQGGRVAIVLGTFSAPSIR